MKVRITKDPKERKQEIIDTAIRLFCQNGYENTSMAAIAKEINVAQGLCYKYFPSKENLFDVSLDQYASLLVSKMIPHIRNYDLPIKERILNIPSFTNLENADEDIYKFVHGKQNIKIHLQLSIKICEKLLPVVQEELKRAEKSGELKISNSENIAYFCVYGQLGIMLDENLTREEQEKAITSSILQILNII